MKLWFFAGAAWAALGFALLHLRLRAGWKRAILRRAEAEGRWRGGYYAMKAVLRDRDGRDVPAGKLP
jgi:hypothetical protein